MKQEVKKLLILNLPYLLFVYLFDKIGAAIRLTPGADASEKLLQLGTGFAAAFSRFRTMIFLIRTTLPSLASISSS